MMIRRILLLAAILAGSAASFAQPRTLSVKEFLRLSPDDTTSYRVRGVVSKVRSSSSGSFYLQDPTGTLLVYGIQSPADPRMSFKQMDIVQGDTLTVLGRFTLYGGTTREMKDGRLMEKSDGPDHNLSFYDRLERKPSFKGKEGEKGLEAFKSWVQAHLRSTGNGQGSVVLIRFIIGRNGGIQEVQVVRGASPDLNDEALRVVRSAPKWKPAKMDGEAVRMTYTIPVTFQ